MVSNTPMVVEISPTCLGSDISTDLARSFGAQIMGSFKSKLGYILLAILKDQARFTSNNTRTLIEIYDLIHLAQVHDYLVGVRASTTNERGISTLWDDLNIIVITVLEQIGYFFCGVRKEDNTPFTAKLILEASGVILDVLGEQSFAKDRLEVIRVLLINF